MSSADLFLVLTGLALLVSQLLAMASDGVKELRQVLLPLGRTAAATAVLGAIRLLIVKAQTLEAVSSIDGNVVFAQGTKLTARDLVHFGSQLLVDDVFVYVIFTISVGLIAWEATVGRRQRDISPTSAKAFAQYVGLGFVPPIFLGAGALYLVYIRS